MVFSSLNFLIVFLPLVLFLHTVAPVGLKNLVLIAASIVFYAWGEPVYIILMLLNIAFNYTIGLQIEGRKKKGAKKTSLVFGVAVNIAMLGFFKYYGFAVDTLNGIFGLELAKKELALPIGISFYTFQALSYVIDVYRGTVPAVRNIVDFGTYITMFPQLVAGPIVKYSDIADRLNARGVTVANFGRGADRFIRGLAKKVILANNLGLLYTELQTGNRTLLGAWLAAAAYMLQIYFDFSGYSDMAIGMGKMLGFNFPENFDHPYTASSITEFWRKWHMTLSGWFRDYVYIPLGGSRVSAAKHIRNLMAVWMLTGLWHGASWNFVLWGLYYGVLLILEKYIFGDLLASLPKAVSRAVTLLAVLVGWVIFANTDFGAMGASLGNLIGIGVTGIADTAFLYSLKSNAVLLLLSLASCAPELGKVFTAKTARVPVLGTVCMIVLLLLSVAMLVSGTYNPFLYFRF